MIRISTKEIVDVMKYAENKAVIVGKRAIFKTKQFKARYTGVDFENKTQKGLTNNA